MSNTPAVKFFSGVTVVAIIFSAVILGMGSGNLAFAQTTQTCSITTTLKSGSTGDEVKCLQTSLGGLAVDGTYGAKTEDAVDKFQKDHGLKVDGIFGPLSRAAWESGAPAVNTSPKDSTSY
ncbi:MAG: peptidoglycan-binding domain-containing protein [Candidatus Paceibacterota bacterium]|jgi:peptidoglycan hydrolase-like protein with peptidoglycan-binding domain